MSTLTQIKRATTTGIGATIWHADSLPSTNATLKEMVADGGAEPGAVVWCDEQTEGRGRLGREWHSPPQGGVFASIFLAGIAPRDLYCLSTLAVRDTVAECGSSDCAVKWPNDVLIADSKVAGILIEQEGDAAIVGIGINTNLTQAELGRIGPGVTSLASASGRNFNNGQVLERLLLHLEAQYFRCIRSSDLLFQDWKAALVTLGQTVEVSTSRETWFGRAVDVAIDGSLLVLNDKRLVRVYAADVRIRPK